MAYPNRFRSNRMTGTTVVDQLPHESGDEEQTLADALGYPINTDFGAPVVVRTADKGVANGVATLGADTKVPSAQLPDIPQVFSGASATGTNQTLASGATVAMTLNAEDYDVGNYHDNVVNNTRMTVGAGLAGYYSVKGHLTFNANATGVRSAQIWKNGVAVSWSLNASAGGGAQHCEQVAWEGYLGVNDYVEVDGYQNSGGDLVVAFKRLQVALVGLA